MNVVDALLAFYECEQYGQEFRMKQIQEATPILKDLRERYGDSLEVLAVFTDEAELLTEQVLVKKTNFKKSLGTCAIYIYTNDNYDESKHPHVHVVSNNKVPNVCVRLDCALYFIHGKHTGTFNNEQAKLFNEIMASPLKDGKSVWDTAKDIHNEQHPDSKITRKHQPNYSLLNELSTEEECNVRDKDK